MNIFKFKMRIRRHVKNDLKSKKPLPNFTILTKKQVEDNRSSAYDYVM